MRIREAVVRHGTSATERAAVFGLVRRSISPWATGPQLKTKNFHWHVSGPHFRDYHLLLDEQAAQIFAATDDMAERVRKIGGVTLRSIGDIARRQTIEDNDESFAAPLEIRPLSAGSHANHLLPG